MKLINWQQTSNNSEDSPAITLSIALSFVSHVIRMAPPSDTRELQDAFGAILEELQERKEWQDFF